MRKVLSPVRALVALTLVTGAACDADSSGDELTPQVVVTTNVLGDVVTAALGDLVGDDVTIEVIMPIGADPHEFALSARQAETMADADLLVVNGLGFEAGLLDVVDSLAADGTSVFAVGGSIHGSDGEPADPHVWMDPVRLAELLDGFGDEVARHTGLDAGDVSVRVDAYLAELSALDRDVEETLSTVPDGRRTLVTNHDSLGYFADRYGMEVIGTIIPSLSTSAEASAAGLEQLAELLRSHDAPAIFVETTESGRLADALAAEVGGDVQIVELFTGSLGEPGSGAATYLDMMRTNAARIAAALTGQP